MSRAVSDLSGKAALSRAKVQVEKAGAFKWVANLRKEYFAVTMDESREAVTKHLGRVTFLLEPDAEQFKETLAIRAEEVPAQAA